MTTEYALTNGKQGQYDLLEASQLPDPFPALAKLRENSPVHWSEKNRFWLISRASDVRMILQTPEVFSSDTGAQMTIRAQQLPPSVRHDFEIGGRFFFGHLQTMDGEKHAQQRHAVMKAMTSLFTGALRRTVAERVDDLIDKVLDDGACDFVSRFAYPLPALVIFDLLGVPPEYHHAIQTAANSFFAFSMASYQGDAERLRQIATSVQASWMPAPKPNFFLD